MPSYTPRAAAMALCATAALGLTAACSSSGGTAAGAADPATSASAAPTASSSKGAPLPTGTELAALLLPASAVPAHLTLDPSGSQDTGTTFNPATSSPVPTAAACDALSLSSWVSAAGTGSISFAQNDYTDGPQVMFSQEIDGFRDSDAHTVITRLTSVFKKCAHFRAKQDGTTYNAKVSHRTLPGLGDEAVKAVLTSPSWEGGSTLIAVRVGKLVVTTMYNDRKTTGSADLALTKALVKRVQAAH